LDDQTIDRAVGETVRRLRGARRKARRRACVAVDATGLAQGSGQHILRAADASARARTAAVEALVDVGGRGGSISAVRVVADRAGGPWNHCANLPTVVEAASRETPIGLVLADAEFDSERNHTYIRQKLGAQTVIPAKRGKKTWRIHGVRAEMRRAFPRRLYRRRSLIESLFSSVKRKLSARAPGRSLRTQKRQALLLGLSFNLYRLKHRCLFLRMSTEPSPIMRERFVYRHDCFICGLKPRCSGADGEK
jgi:DDE family transposase